MWLARARLRDDLPLAVLELTRRSETTGNDGSVSTSDDLIHVPIPHGREGEARKVARELARASLTRGEDD